MQITEIQSFSVSHLVTVPHAVAWSKHGCIAMATKKGVHIVDGCDGVWSKPTLMHGTTMLTVLAFVLLLQGLAGISCSDITYPVFGSMTDGMPAAFGDFNSDEYTDLFVLKDNQRTVEILLGSELEPFLRPASNLKCTFRERITSVVPGDFDGDALMDVLVTLESNSDSELNSVHVLWGGLSHLTCSGHTLFTVRGQPLAMDHNQDMIIDLFGWTENRTRVFWIFSKNRTAQEVKPMSIGKKLMPLRNPQSHAFLDLNDDSSADLYVTTTNASEIWLWDSKSEEFLFNKTIPYPPSGTSIKSIGQTLFLDVELKGKIDHVIPVCADQLCTLSSISVFSSGVWYDLKVNFHNGNDLWTFVPPNQIDKLYLDTITLHGGDFNMDGYPDLLATLQFGTSHSTFLLENVACDFGCGGFSRTFAVRWGALSPYNNDTILGVFYDFLQDGILDVILVHDKPSRNVSAFKNSLDYDANFVKVMVLTGLTNNNQPPSISPLGKRRKTYGTNLPGPKISYETTTIEGNPRAGVSVQIPQSAHFALNLPYTIFGLGRTPNFVDTLFVAVAGESRAWTQIIPNSQMVVIPWPPTEPSHWVMQLFVTPSKIILQSVLALLGTCVIISCIIGMLYWKERREDHLEKLQEAHKFHFDAM